MFLFRPTPSFLFCVLAVTLTATCVAGKDFHNIELTTVPDTVTEHLTKHLMVKCSIVPDPNSTINIPLSLTIKKSTIRYPNNYTDVAIINSLNSEVFGQFKYNATHNGQVNQDGSNSYLEVHWDYPVFDLTGSYMCEMTGFDATMHIVTISNTTQVSDSKPDLVAALTELQKYESRIKALEKGLLGLQAAKDTLFIATSADGKYMVSRPIMRNSAVSESLCGLYGGYLAEFDLQEYEQIKDFLRVVANNRSLDKAHMLINGTVLVGLTDEFVEGEWRFRAHPATVAASYTNWQPVTGSDVNCAVMDALQDWRMAPVPCYDNMALVHFLCEMDTPTP